MNTNMVKAPVFIPVRKKAEAWKEEIAKNWWTSEGFDGEPPAIGAGDEYFEAMSDRNEFFSVLELEIDP